MWLPFQLCEIGIYECEIAWAHVKQLWTNAFFFPVEMPLTNISRSNQSAY